MPSLLNKNNTQWKKILSTILDLRLGNNSKLCVADHEQEDSFCCLNSNISKEEIIINFLQRDTDHLLERWIIQYEQSLTSVSTLLDSLTQFMHTHPIAHQVYAMIAINQQLCYTHTVPDRMIEFRKLARLTASRFHSEAVSIQVVLDETMMRPNDDKPLITVRRLSRLSLSAIEPDYTPIPIPHIMQYTTHRNAIAYSTSPSPSFLPSPRRNSIHDHGCLVGSFEESLFSGRMSSQPSKPFFFHCQLGVLGYDCKPSLKCPSHWSLMFPATFYDLQEDHSTPYVGTVDLADHVRAHQLKAPGYRIPPKGQIQVVVKNPNKTAVKLFLIPYDFQDMPKNTKTFLRQKSYALQSNHTLLRYAIHLHVCRTERRIYIYRSIRIVFANRIADAGEKFKVVCEGPKEPVYVPL